eukprot:scaffold36527_cov64-Phaeocystis_antarctica.AAC.1
MHALGCREAPALGGGAARHDDARRGAAARRCCRARGGCVGRCDLSAERSACGLAAVSAQRGDLLQERAPLRDVVSLVELEAARLEEG